MKRKPKPEPIMLGDLPNDHADWELLRRYDEQERARIRKGVPSVFWFWYWVGFAVWSFTFMVIALVNGNYWAAALDGLSFGVDASFGLWYYRKRLLARAYFETYARVHEKAMCYMRDAYTRLDQLHYEAAVQNPPRQHVQ